MGLTTMSPEIGVLLLTVLLYGVWRFYQYLRIAYLTPLRNLPGPPAGSWAYGNMKEIAAMDNTLLPDVWFKRYGKVFVDCEFLMRPRLWSLDPRAMQHVLSHPNDFPPPEETQKALQMVLGRGLLSVSGEEHRKQRRILNPAFGPAQVRDLTHIFVEKSIQLREYWANVVRSGSTRVNVNKDLSKLTLDIIGVAGFGYDFNTLNPEGKPNELSLAFSRLFMSSPSISSLVPFLRTLFPILKLIRTERVATIEAASEVFHRVGMQLVEERKGAILKEMSEKHLQGVERKDLQGRDLLTLLMRANMAKDVPENQRLSDKEVLDQIPTFLLAGHETTSTSSTWALYALSKNPDLQKKLREELLTVQSDTPTMEELSALPYLDAVVTETLRLYTPATTSFRVASKDSVIPLSEPFTDCHGKVHSELRVAKGNKVVIPILAMNRSAEIWGEDSLEFRPERWQQPPEAISAIPGVWGHLLTFIGGPRACIGFRFSIIELKAILFTLIRAFEFELAVPAEDIVAKTEGLQRPSLLSEPETRYQLPLLVKPYSTS